MIKKLINFILMLALILQLNISVYAEDDIVIFDESFEKEWGNIETNSGDFASPDYKYGMSASMPELKYSTIGKFFPQVINSGRYIISFDFYTDNTGTETFRFVDEKAGNMASMLRNVLTFRTDGYIGINRVAPPNGESGDGEYDWPSVQDPELRRRYKENEWNSFKICLDMDNSEIAYHLNGEVITCIPFDLNVEGIKGFSFCKYESSPGAFYIDNLKMIKEDYSNSNAFDPVCVKAKTSSDIIGNNFYADNMPCFDISFTNRLNASKAYNVIYTVFTNEGEELWKKTDKISLGESETITDKLFISCERYGVMELVISFSDGNNYYTKTIPYTLSNHTADMPNNKRSGIHGSVASGKDIADKAVSVLKGAGIGNLRGEELGWSSIEKDGKYSLNAFQEKWLDMLHDNDIDYLFLLNAGHPDYAAETNVNNLPFKDDTGYTALSKYIEELMKLAKGRIKYVEVLNEVHAKLNRGYTNDLIGDIHKAVYKGVQAGDKNVLVVGIDEDSYAYNVVDYISGYLEEMGGEKCFDAVSLHPYPRTQDGAPFYFEENKASKTFVNGVRGKLKDYGYDYDTPIIFSELGWGDTNPDMNYIVDYERQASYIIRAHAYTWANGLADILFNFCLSDNMDVYDSDPKEATFGICESYTKSGTEVPYLGKPVYCALAYYNGLMAEAEYKGQVDLNIQSSYGYSFEDRKGREITMLGMLTDGAEEKLSYNTEAEYVILSDIYGNEKLIKTNNCVLELTLTDVPQYLISCTERPKAVIEGSASPNTEIRINIYRNDDTECNIYWSGISNTDSDGNYKVSIPVDTGGKGLTAYIRTEDESSERVYDIYEKKSYVLTACKNETSGTCELSASVTTSSNSMLVVCRYDGNVLVGAEVKCVKSEENVLKSTFEITEDVKCFLFENSINIIPVDEYTVIKSER